MMQIWIAWCGSPMACFSSEERALEYIHRQANAHRWQCIAAPLNPDSFVALAASLSGGASAVQHGAHH
ncbi:MAG: hypothetical protein REI09_04850 [Candidatus Dactylopiibacterium sp.]|nr:hypothetical protein [Candidatus Dactylopiibacterium sp.]